MAYTLSAGVSLGGSKTGLAVGYRLVNLAGTVTAAFTTANVAETTIPGNYTVANGIPAPSGFAGRIVWGTAGADMAENWINPNQFDAVFQADAVLKRGVANVEGTADLMSVTEFVLAALHATTSGTSLVIKRSDGTTFSTRSITTDANATPVTSIS